MIDLWLIWMSGVCIGLLVVWFDIRFTGKLCLLGGILWFEFWWLDWLGLWVWVWWVTL